MADDQVTHIQPPAPPQGRAEYDEQRQDEGRRNKEQDKKKQDGQKQNDQDKQKQGKPARWPWFAGGALILGFVAVVLYMVFVPKSDVWTDDAYVMVHYATIAPRVSGQVQTVAVDDNQPVKAGQVLATLDPRDFEARVAQAQATLDRDTAQLADATANVARQPSLITGEQARVAQAQAQLNLSDANRKRYGNLAASGAGTLQQHQQADATFEQDTASLQAAQASLEAAQRQMDVLKASQSANQATINADRAQLDQAKLNLSYTKILAPVDGVVGQRTVEVGNYVAPGGAVMTVVPLDQVYLVANYREEDLRHVRSGQDVTIHVDAYDIKLRGVVDSISPASGAIFSPIPPNNATGNFTKIVQRLPVKIAVAPDQPQAWLLRVGFSVETTIHTGLADVVGEQERSTARLTVH